MLFRKLKTPQVAMALFIAAAALAWSSPAQAQDTAAGTSIDNQAVVGYSVGGAPQTAIESSPTGNSTPGAGALTSFLVDARIDLEVLWADGTNVTSAPGQTGAVTTWTVENQGNGTSDFVLSAANNPNGTLSPDVGVDNFQVTFPAATFYIETNGTPGLQIATDTQQNYINDLAAGATQTVYLLSDIPAVQVTNDISVVTLRATAHEATGTPGVLAAEDVDGGDADGIDEVFADPDSDADTFPDGYEEALGAYIVQTAALTITKTSVVISDPINGTTNPIAIPGAVVEYVITIANAGPATATNVTVSDDLTTEIVAGTIAYDPNGYAAGFGMQVTAPNINAGAPTNLSNVVDADVGDFGFTAANTVTVTGITLTNAQNGIVRFRVIIQ